MHRQIGFFFFFFETEAYHIIQLINKISIWYSASLAIGGTSSIQCISSVIFLAN